MKTENIVTDVEGLRRILDFLHSEVNVIGTAGETERDAQHLEARIFYLDMAKVRDPNKIYSVIGEAKIEYLVSIASNASIPSTNSEQKAAAALLKVLSEVVYKEK